MRKLKNVNKDQKELFQFTDLDPATIINPINFDNLDPSQSLIDQIKQMNTQLNNAVMIQVSDSHEINQLVKFSARKLLAPKLSDLIYKQAEQQYLKQGTAFAIYNFLIKPQKNNLIEPMLQELKGLDNISVKQIRISLKRSHSRLLILRRVLLFVPFLLVSLFFVARNAFFKTQK